ncbi:MAG: flagellar hook-length control protein FliK [Rhodobacteraceae bacterium]|nr:MAG: flagellar hook-length control protein FliK [Paracoccaceae bacterium]
MIPISLIETGLAPHPDKAPATAPESQTTTELFGVAFEETAALAPTLLLHTAEKAILGDECAPSVATEKCSVTLGAGANPEPRSDMKNTRQADSATKTPLPENCGTGPDCDRFRGRMPPPQADAIRARTERLSEVGEDADEARGSRPRQNSGSGEENAGMSEAPAPSPALPTPLSPPLGEGRLNERGPRSEPAGTVSDSIRIGSDRPPGAANTGIAPEMQDRRAILPPLLPAGNPMGGMAFLEASRVEPRSTPSIGTELTEGGSDAASAQTSPEQRSQVGQLLNGGGGADLHAGRNAASLAGESDLGHQTAATPEMTRITPKQDILGAHDPSLSVGTGMAPRDSIEFDRGATSRTAVDMPIARLMTPEIQPDGPARNQISDVRLGPDTTRAPRSVAIEPTKATSGGDAPLMRPQASSDVTVAQAGPSPHSGAMPEKFTAEPLAPPPATHSADAAQVAPALPVTPKIVADNDERLSDLRASSTEPPLARPDLPLATLPEPQRTASAPPAPALAQSVGQQIGAALAQMPDQPIEISLSPEELGRVRLTLHAHDQAMTVAIQAERPETLDLMRRHIDSLAREMRELGYGALNFTFDQNSDQSAFAQRDMGGDAQDRPTPPSLEMPEPLRASFVPIRSAASGLDLRM